MGTGKGHNKSAREKAYSSLYRLLDHRQRVLIMLMKAKNKRIKKTVSLNKKASTKVKYSHDKGEPRAGLCEPSSKW